jgi:hypothetical protein
MRVPPLLWLSASVLVAAGLGVAEFGLGQRAGAAAQGQELTQQQRDMIADAMAPQLVLPETAQYRFDAPKPYVDGASVVCGQVNYQSAGRVYTGFHNFYAILQNGAVTLAQIDAPDEDATGKLRLKLKVLCGRG